MSVLGRILHTVLVITFITTTTTTTTLTVTAAPTDATVAAAKIYQPVAYSTTAILGSRLYVIGGQTDLTNEGSFTSQIATLSLSDSFDGDSIPWVFMPGTFATARAPGVAGRDQRRIFFGGNVNNVGRSPIMAFDTTTQVWTQGPDIPPKSASSPGNPDDNENESKHEEDDNHDKDKKDEKDEKDEKNKENILPPAATPYSRTASGVALDSTATVLVQFGGANATGQPTNELSLLDPGRYTGILKWIYWGTVPNVPALYAPLMVYLPNSRQTLIMGGCDVLDTQGHPTQCVGFETVYTLSSDTVSSTVPIVRRVNVSASSNGAMPAPRVMACVVALDDGNVFLFGGGNPKSPLADAWILNVQTWTWSERPIEDLPSEGIMGHGCELTKVEQILVIGGHHGDTFVSRPLSVIRLKDWSWKDQFDVPGFSTGVKIGLSLSSLVVLGAILAGLFIRRRRSKRAKNSLNVKVQPSTASSTSSSQPLSHHHHYNSSQGRSRSGSGRTRRDRERGHGSRSMSIQLEERGLSLDGLERNPAHHHQHSQTSDPQIGRRHSTRTTTDYTLGNYPNPTAVGANGSSSVDGSISSSTVVGSIVSHVPTAIPERVTATPTLGHDGQALVPQSSNQ
ncbi:hypothetical protein BGZ94_002074 [Podila epigama]|nr:hypothetical protein BGZ94_002074 [Podila epigama]